MTIMMHEDNDDGDENGDLNALQWGHLNAKSFGGNAWLDNPPLPDVELEFHTIWKYQVVTNRKENIKKSDIGKSLQFLNAKRSKKGNSLQFENIKRVTNWFFLYHNFKMSKAHI